MRLLVANEGIAEAGGVDSYLTAVLRELTARGHDVAFLHYNRLEESGDWPNALVSQTFGVLDAGLEAVMSAIHTWGPDVCFVHNMQALDVDRALLSRWPVVKMMHGYMGTCIGGQKSFAWPQREPCGRRFGAACLALYLPRRCGQLSVRKMLEHYRWASAQRELFASYASIVVASEHMGEEYRRNGVDPDLVRVLPLFAPQTHDAADFTLPAPAPGRRVTFLGRMTKLKGGDMLVRAVAHLVARSGVALELVMAGDGPQRSGWEALARTLGVPAVFPGWIAAPDRERLLKGTSVLAVPSVWPEPFGLVGLEAGLLGVPAVAFDVGGIREWLRPGVSGFLAPGQPPTAEGLATALSEALTHAADPRFRSRTREAAQSMSLKAHVDRLEAVLKQALGTRR